MLTNPAREAFMEKMGLDDQQMVWIEQQAEGIALECKQRQLPPFLCVLFMMYTSYLVGGMSGLPVTQTWSDLFRDVGRSMSDAAKFHGEHLLEREADDSTPGPYTVLEGVGAAQ